MNNGKEKPAVAYYCCLSIKENGETCNELIGCWHRVNGKTLMCALNCDQNKVDTCVKNLIHFAVESNEQVVVHHLQCERCGDRKKEKGS